MKNALTSTFLEDKKSSKALSLKNCYKIENYQALTAQDHLLIVETFGCCDRARCSKNKNQLFITTQI